MSPRDKAVRRALRAAMKRGGSDALRALGNGLTCAILEAHTQGRIHPYRDGVPTEKWEGIFDAALSEFISGVQRALKVRTR